MDYRILLADDSPTIQKVVKITLANEPYQIEDCSEASQLEKKMTEVNPHIVLLDFNLSEDKTGYQLAELIYEKNPQTKIMMLFGTFDTIDDDQLKAAHVAAKIVKPFDGTKFINTCRNLIEDLTDTNDTILSQDSEEEVSFEENELPAPIEESSDDEWVVNQPDVIEEEEPVTHLPKMQELSELDKEAMDWGMGIPSVIGEEESNDTLDIPDIISEAEAEIETAFEMESSASFPENDDLDYPDVIEINEKIDAEDFEYTEDDSDEEGPLITLEDIELAENENGTTSALDIERLQAQIADETDDDDLWSADTEEEESFTEDFPEKIHDEVFEEEIIEDEEENNDEYDLDKTLEDQLDDDFPEVTPHRLEAVTSDYTPSETSSPVDVSELADILFEKLKPVIEEEMKKYCKEMVEKVAWEVIPDLAENLIKKQIEKITDDVLNSD